jgi:hypothetical protein
VSTDRYTFVRSVRDSRLDSSLPREIAPGLSATLTLGLFQGCPKAIRSLAHRSELQRQLTLLQEAAGRGPA